MDDHAINKRMAEIAFVKVREGRGPGGARAWHLTTPGFPLWDPVNDWGQAGPLLRSCSFRQMRLRGGGESASVRYHGTGRVGLCEDGGTQLRSICLALIDANEEGEA